MKPFPCLPHQGRLSKGHKRVLLPHHGVTPDGATRSLPRDTAVYIELHRSMALYGNVRRTSTSHSWRKMLCWYAFLQAPLCVCWHSALGSGSTQTAAPSSTSGLLARKHQVSLRLSQLLRCKCCEEAPRKCVRRESV